MTDEKTKRHLEDLERRLEDKIETIKEDIMKNLNLSIQNHLQHQEPSRETKEKIQALEEKWKSVSRFFVGNIIGIVMLLIAGTAAFTRVETSLDKTSQDLNKIISSGLIKQDAIILENKIIELDRRLDNCEKKYE